MTRTETPRIDRDDERGARSADRLVTERVGWLTTVAPDGTPQSSPIWFIWYEDELCLYSLKSPRVRNIMHNPRVSFNLDGNRMGGDIVVIEGTARIAEEAPSAAENSSYLAKYKPVMEERGWTPEWFADRYSVPIRIRPTKFRYW